MSRSSARAAVRPLLLSLLALLVLAAPAAARSGPCRVDGSGPTCRLWSGKVTFVADGDTISVDVAGDGTSRPVRIRLVGVQAMEQRVYSKYAARRRGECHALAATARLERLLRAGRNRVRLAAQDPGSRSGSRLRRIVATRIDGAWREVAADLLGEGHALWLPNRTEWATNADYRALAVAAAQARRRLWNPASCGAGPGAADGVSLRVNWDAEGNDADNPNGEWFEIRNPGATALRLGGWWVRDSALRRYTLPGSAVIEPGSRLRVHVGRGSGGGRELYWGLSAPAFENAGFDRRSMGDGGYLFDPDGDLRAWHIYP
jgi:endonuclease YncB( thermonuclease family)